MKQGWEIKTIEEVCKIYNGGTPDTTQKQYWEGNHLWITPKDMGKNEGIYVDDTERKITDAGLKNSSAKMLPINSIILSSRAPIGHLAINTKEMATNQGCKGLVPKKSIQPLYLYYFLKNSVELLNRLGSGTTFKELSGTKLAGIEIPLPPYPEQKRIVAILDEAFAAIDTAKANAEKNLQNARELFETYVDNIFANPGEGWEEKKLGDVYDVRDGTHYSPKFQKSGYAFVTSRNLKNGKLDFNKIQYISEDDYNEYNKRSKVHKGDILFAMIGTIGNPVVVEVEPNFAIKNVALIIVPKGQSNYFLSYYLNSNFVIDRINRNTKGTTQKFVGLGNLRNFEISLPNFEIQKSVVRKLDNLASETQKLEAIYQKKLTDLEELKKLLLQKAFNGEL